MGSYQRPNKNGTFRGIAQCSALIEWKKEGNKPKKEFDLEEIGTH